MTTGRILVVEDNDKNLKLTRDVLEFAGYTVEVATTGEEVGRASCRERVCSVV